MTVTALSDALLDRAAAEVAPLLKEMLSYDTTIRGHGDPPREERAHQEFLVRYLRDLDAEVELFEPAASEFDRHPMYLTGQTFEGRPVLWARIRGTGKGRSLLFNGHYDTVVVDPLEEWEHDPWAGEIVEGRLYGRGSCDMKGGIAAALAAAHVLVAEGIRLSGDLYFNVVPFEEINGMGTAATVLRGFRADAAVCCEPTELNTLIACRGVLLGQLDVSGRSAHAEIVQPHHSLGGGVNAIDKLVHLLLHLRDLNDEWRTRPDKQHCLLSTPYVLTTVCQGGGFASNWPAAAWAILNCCYLPGEADEKGFGTKVKAEIEACVHRAAQTDSWLRDHPPTITWVCDFPPGELEPSHALVAAVSESARRQGVGHNRLVGFDTWADQVLLMKEGGVPCVCFGPGSITSAHAVDEHVPIAELETCARVFLDLILAWTASGA